MVGVLVNFAGIFLGGFIGVFLNKRIPKEIAESMLKGCGIIAFTIGISGAIKSENALITVIAFFIGALIGMFIKISDRLDSFGQKLSAKLTKGKNSGFGAAFVSSSLLFCIGSMAIMGSIESGILKDNSTLFAKSVIDCISSIMFAATMGPGVILSSVSVFVVEGAMTLMASWIAPYLTSYVITEIVAVGSLLLIGTGLNVIGITKLKIADYLPAIFIAALLAQFM